MNNFDRNTRTLIVSFLVAIFALIPLRFIEAGQEQSYVPNSQVLGESISVSDDKKVENNKPVFEAPYDEIEKCTAKNEVKAMEEGVIKLIRDDKMPKEQLVTILNELQKVENNVCP